MKFLLSYNLKMFILWWEEPLVGESTGGEMKKFLASGWNLSNKYTVLNLRKRG